MAFSGEFSLDVKGLGVCMEFIEDSLKRYRIKKYDLLEALLMSEETLLQLMDHAPEGAAVKVKVSRWMGIPRIRLLAPGTVIKFDEKMDKNAVNALNDESQKTISRILLMSFENSIKYHRTKAGNSIMIITGIPERSLSRSTVSALVLSAVLGTLLRMFVPQNICVGLVENFLQPMETALVSALMLIAAPAVFASVTCSTFRFEGFSELGRSSKAVVFCYMLTSIAATIIGGITFQIFKPGEVGILSQFASHESVGEFSAANVLSTLVPKNIVEPFLNVNSLQLMMMALVIGMGLMMGGSRVRRIRKFMEEMDVLCGKISGIVMAVVPFGVFCSTTKLIVNSSTDVFYSIGELVAALLVGLLFVFFFYIAILVAVARLSPLQFLRRYKSDMKSTLLKGSGVAAIPITMRACLRFGVPKNLVYYAIPLGATINMDGNCVGLTLISLFFSRLCGTELHGGDMFVLLFLVLILSLGAPIAPGTIILCTVTLLNQMGISLDVISLIIGVNFMLEMLMGMMNCIGDMVVALAVSKLSGTLDTSMYSKAAK